MLWPSTSRYLAYLGSSASAPSSSTRSQKNGSFQRLLDAAGPKFALRGFWFQKPYFKSFLGSQSQASKIWYSDLGLAEGKLRLRMFHGRGCLHCRRSSGAMLCEGEYGSKDYINIRILRHMISGIPLILGRGTRM